MQNKAWHCPAEIEKLLSWQPHFSPSLCINGTFIYMQITHAVGTPIRSQRLVFCIFRWYQSDSLFHLWFVESDVRFSQKQAEMWTRLTTELYQSRIFCFVFVCIFFIYHHFIIITCHAFILSYSVLVFPSLVFVFMLIWARTQPESASALFGYFRDSGIFIELPSLLIFWNFPAVTLVCIVIISP